MDFLDEPSVEIWGERQRWIEKISDDASNIGSFIFSEQACALTIDLQIAFCAGAWIAVIILALSIIDAHLREIEVPDFSGNTKKLIEEINMVQELDWIRERRNRLVHLNVENPEITVDDQ